METKSVIPFHSYSLAPIGESWDAGTEIRAADISDLKKICAWYDESKPSIKSSYKLPHHKASAYTTVWNGVKAAMGALLGARGGVDIPEGDRKGVYEHLVKHYKEFNKEAPAFKDYDDEELIKLFPEEFENLGKDELAEEIEGKSEVLKNERAIIHFISTPHVDRQKDSMNPFGIMTNEFDKTKTVFYNHIYIMPIARNDQLFKTKDGVRAKTLFPKTTELSNDIYTLHEQNVLNSWSIGYNIPKTKSAFNYDEETGVRNVMKWNLIEYSSAPLAANPNCLDLAKDIVKSVELKSQIQVYQTNSEVYKMLEDNTKQINELKELIKNNSNDNLKVEIDELKKQLTKKAVGIAGSNDERKRRIAYNAALGAISRITGKKLKLN